MFSSTSNPSPNTITLNAANLIYILKFGLSLSIAQHINSRLILNDIHTNNPTIASDIELNLWALNCQESYQLSFGLVKHMIFEVFCKEYYRWGYTEFIKLDQHIRQAFKETLIAKGIYMGQPSSHVNQRLANFIIEKQLPTWDKNDLRNYKTMYLTSKA